VKTHTALRAAESARWILSMIEQEFLPHGMRADDDTGREFEE